jgi:predicted AlkP superfamily phosphohydrolase/phosphomutase
VARLAARSALGKRLKERFRSPSVLDWSKTIAYASVTGGGVSLNVRGREVGGILDPARYDEMRSEVRERLLAFRDPQTGEAPIDAVAPREELPAGRFVDKAPDLMVEPSPLWSFTALPTSGAPTEWPSGAHRRTGIVAAAGGRVRSGTLGDREIIDMAATALAFAGVPAPGLDGRAIEEISGRPLDERGEPAGAVARVSGGMTSEDEQQVAQHLRELGYIE